MMGLSDLFSKEKFPQLRNYTVLVASLIVGGGFLTGGFGKDKENRKAVDDVPRADVVWVHSVSMLWEESPVEVERGEEVEIWVSGRYYDSAKEFLDNPAAARKLTASGMKWNTHSRDSLNALISAQSNYGQLILQLCKGDDEPVPQPELKDIVQLEQGYNRFRARHDGILWFATNHAIANPLDKSMTASEQRELRDSLLRLAPGNHPEANGTGSFGQLTLQIRVANKEE